MVDRGTEVEVIHLWSSCRSVSTTSCILLLREMILKCSMNPSIRTFLHVTGAERPYREEVLSKMESDGNKVVKEIIFGPGRKKYRFCKHMASQLLPGLRDELMKKGKHCILMRNPLDVLTSYDKVLPPLFVDLGYDCLVYIYNELSDEGKPPPVIDSDQLRQDPENNLSHDFLLWAALRGLCDDLELLNTLSEIAVVMVHDRLNFDFIWEPGSRPFDGLWTPYWYNTTHKSTGFDPPGKYPSVSVFDSIVQDGDGIWEGLQVYNGKIFKLEEHLDRQYGENIFTKEFPNPYVWKVHFAVTNMRVRVRLHIWGMLFDSAKALAFSNVPSPEEVIFYQSPLLNYVQLMDFLVQGIFMYDGVCSVSRLVVKEAIFKTLVTSGKSPELNLHGCS
ncbi:D-amino-acid transaminase [Handroanthus impetiginosus]|uniref:D-amino-acid transaminase n=1 Tax=Handroanthus impetiginosus TaxID=429701 RepID=A0A2G9H9U7_9LAMI|nr:D-amino-acid transaminase [Handroanthus impetiginosus]